MKYKSTVLQVSDQSGRTALVTGANKGLGLIVARELAKAGVFVIIASRSEDRGKAAVRNIKELIPDAQLEYIQLDLASLDSVHKCVEEFKKTHDQLDILVNNGAVALIPSRRVTKDGFEMQLGTNYLGHFALTGLLLDCLRRSPAARVVSIGGQVHLLGKMNFEDIQSKHNYGRWKAYGQSKLATLLYMREFNKRLKKAQSSIMSVAAHPGVTNTRHSSLGQPFLDKVINAMSVLSASSPEIGAQPFIYAATASDLPGGSYVGPAKNSKLPKIVLPGKRAQNDEDAKKLWALSEELTNVQYKFS